MRWWERKRVEGRREEGRGRKGGGGFFISEWWMKDTLFANASRTPHIHIARDEVNFNEC